jgi:hypothetical protein
MRRYSILVLAGLVFAISGANCLDILNQNKQRTATLKSFSSGEELRSYFANQAKTWMRNSRGSVPVFGGLPSGPPDGQNTSGDAATGGEGGAADGAADYSGTNLQEAGVDESDIVKNDGSYIYVLDGELVHVAAASPLAEVASIQLESWGDSLYLYGDKLIALSQEWVWYPMPLMMDMMGSGVRGAAESTVVSSEPPMGGGGGTSDGSVGAVPPADGGGGSTGSGSSDPNGGVQDGDIIGGPWNDGGQVLVTVINVADPANPTVEAKIRLEGSLVSSRMIGGNLHVVLITTPRIPSDIWLPLQIDQITLDEWLPDYEVVDGSGTTKQSGNVVGWADISRPDDPQGYGLTNVVTIDADNPTAEPVSTGIVANAGTIYASTDALYVTDTQYDWSTIWTVARTDTEVHKLRFTETGTEYAGSGLVPGRPLNQYSLGEHEGYLRIATTEDDFSGANGSTNNVYVLTESGEALEIVRSVEDIGKGETIYAARFIGDRGFVVTFRRTDPLFVIDLSNPTSPRMAGELVSPGYSDHIQLLDENHLLTIGKDATADGDFAWVKGVQLSIFDVTDMENPQLTHREIIGGRGTNSEANYNPKAFNYFKPSAVDYGLLAFPIDVYDAGTSGNPWSYGEWKFSGLMVYRVTAASGFEYLGGISSVDTSATNGCYWGYYGGFTRGVFIGENVYSVTPNAVKQAPISEHLTVSADIEFAGAEPAYDYCGGWIEPMVMMPEAAVDLR